VRLKQTLNGIYRQPRGDSNEKWVGVLDGTFIGSEIRIPRTFLHQIMFFKNLKNPELLVKWTHLLGSEIVIWVDLFAPFRVNFKISCRASLPTFQESPPPSPAYRQILENLTENRHWNPPPPFRPYICVAFCE